MKEELLKAILQILAIIAKEEEVKHDERESVRHFLLQNLRKSDTGRYMEYFDRLISGEESATLEQSQEAIIKLTEELNKELTREQKVILIVNIMQLIVADGQITETEEELLFLSSEQLRIPKRVTERIKHYAAHNEINAFTTPDYLIISDREESHVSSAHYVRCEGCPGFVCILYIPRYRIHFIKTVGMGEDLLLNGTPLHECRPINFSPGSAVRVGNQTFYHADIVRYFMDKQTEGKLHFVADNISYNFPGGRRGLKNISLREDSGQLVAIMGGSGSGKSTLINVLNGNLRPKSGSVSINNVSIHGERNKVAGLIGYVPQEDLIIDELTVFQNLYYASKLCFGGLSNKAVHKRVDKVLHDLGLFEVRCLRVGSPLDKVISGGQRKRINIGLELIREPSILFVDEPTSGLSSRDSENIINLLKDVSLKNKLVFTVIHQPSSDIFKVYDRLLIMDRGYQIYYGNPISALIYFKRLIESVDREHSQCIECGNVNAEQIFNIIESKIIDEFGRETVKRKVLPAVWRNHFEKTKYSKVDSSLDSVPPLPRKRLQIASRLSQMVTFTRRDFFSKVSNMQYMLINFMEPVALAGILAFVVYNYGLNQGGYSFSGNPNIPAFFFMSIMVALFMGMTVSAEEIFKDRKIRKREAFLHLNRTSYLLSKLVILFSLSAIQTITYVLIGDFILEIKSMTFDYWLVLFSISCFANLLGLNISSIFNSVVTIYIVVPLLLIPQIILSGTVIDFDEINPSIGTREKVPWIGELIASRWAYEALIVTQFKNNPYTQSLYSMDARIATAEYTASHWVPGVSKRVEKAIELSRLQAPAEEIEKELVLVRNEICRKVAVYGEDKLPFPCASITAESFDEGMRLVLLDFLSTVKKIYSRDYKKAAAEKEQIMERANTPELKKQVIALKERFYNERLGQVARDILSDRAIAEENGKLIRIASPIYAYPDPSNALSFRTRLFYPVKHFLGYYFPTLYFNVAIIWLMTALLFITLHINLIRVFSFIFFLGGGKRR